MDDNNIDEQSATGPNNPPPGGVALLVGQQNIISGSIKPRHLQPNSTSSAGDIYYVDSNGVFTKLPIGSSGQVIKVTGGLPAWGANGITGPTGPTGASFPSVESNTSSATPAPAGTTNVFELSAQTVTAAFAPSGGTPANGQPLRVIVTSSNSATARPLTWSSATGGYVGQGLVALPSTTATGKSTICDFVYTSTNAPAMWRILNAVTGA